MKRLSLVLILLLASACGTTQEAATASIATSAADGTGSPRLTPTAAPSASGLRIDARPLAGIGGLAIVSPNGKWIAAPEPRPAGKVPHEPTVLLFDAAGSLIRKLPAPIYAWSWLPDSTGLFAALDTPQRAATLGIAEIDGRVTTTGLQFADPMLSRDGRWILAGHQEGCCAGIEQKEVWIAPRTGGATKVLARTGTAETQPIALLGVDARERLVYRDATEMWRIPIAGGAPQRLAASPEFPRTVRGSTSPDGLAILVRGYEPQRWYVVEGDAVTLFDATSGDIVEDGQGMRLAFGTAPIWTGPHEVLVRGSFGLVRHDLLTGRREALAGTLRPGDLALVRGADRLLVARGTRAVVIDLSTGREGDAGIDLGTEVTGTRAFALPSAGFILSTASATYRID